MSRIAVIGSGVAGLVSAYYLSKTDHVDLFESDTRVGGHTHTVIVPSATGPKSVDTGFIVFNEKNYPNFLKFLSDLGVGYQDSDMSFSYQSADQKMVWGSDFPFGIFCRRRHWVSPRFYQFLKGIHQFNRDCLRDFDLGLPPELSLGDYLARRDVSRAVVTHYVLPMTSAIWSASFEDSLKFPMVSFIQFWKNHHLLEIGSGLPWKTIQGGSHSYIQKALPQISGSLFKSTPVVRVQELPDGVTISTPTDDLQYDAVIVATHADTALALLSTPSTQQAELLGRWRYSSNQTVLHTDSNVMPQYRSAWSSWNVRQAPLGEFGSPVTVTYWMNRLQSIVSDTPYFVTLNPSIPIDSTQIVKEMTYTHPVMSRDAMATQSRLPHLNAGSRVVFCGSYFGYGFHEDAVAAAVGAVDALRGPSSVLK